MIGGLLARLLPSPSLRRDLASIDPEAGARISRGAGAFAWNGLFFPPAGRILEAGILLTWFVSHLSDAAIWVALIIPIQYGFALLAQPLVAEWIAGRRGRLTYYRRQAAFRGALWAVLGGAVWLLDLPPSLLLTIFFAIVIGDAVAAGVGNIAFNDGFARLIPSPFRGRVRGARGVIGGITAVAAAALLREWFEGRSGIEAFAVPFVAAAVLYALGGLLLGSLEEPAAAGTPEAPRRFRASAVLSNGRALWRQRPFRRFVYAQSLAVPLLQSLPFFMLFAQRSFALELRTIALFIAVDAVAPPLANAFWGRLADRLGNRSVMAFACAAALVAPAAALALAALRPRETAAIAIFALVVFTIRAASQGFDLAAKNFVFEIATSDRERPLAIGLSDMLVGIPTTLLVAGGVLIDVAGFVPLFVAIALFGLLAFGLTLMLPGRDR